MIEAHDPTWTQTFLALCGAGLLLVFTQPKCRSLVADRRGIRVGMPSTFRDVIELAALAHSLEDFQQIKIAAAAALAADGMERRGHQERRSSAIGTDLPGSNFEKS